MGNQGTVIQNHYGAAPPSSGKAVLLLADAADAGALDPLRKRLAEVGDVVIWRHDEAWTAQDDADLASATRVLVAWSVNARRSARVEAGLDAAARARRPRGFVSAESIDGARVPSDIDGRPRTAWGRTLAAAGVTAFWAWWLGQADGAPVWAAALSVLAGWVLAVAGWTGLPRRMEASRLLHDAASAVGRADVPDVLRVSERVLGFVFGPTWSWRALLTGAAPTVLVVAFAASVSGDYFAERGASWTDGARYGLSQTWTLILGNVLLDLFALQVTRTLLPWILRKATAGRIALGLAADLVVLSACTVGAAAANLANLGLWMDLGLGWTGWVEQVFAWLRLGLTGQLSLQGLLSDPFASQITGTALGVLTGSFASAVHLGLLAAVVVDRVALRLPSRVAGAMARRIADSVEGPSFWTWAAGSFLVAAVTTPSPEATCAPDAPCWPQWRRVDLPEECDPCRIGSPPEEPGRFAGEAVAEVRFRLPVEVMDRELSQGFWAASLATELGDADGEHSTHLDTLRSRLAAVHPVVVGDPALPMHDVSWCDAARFANLLALAGGLEPAHLEGEDPTLPACEGGGAVSTRLDRGPRLPTEAEWEVLARGRTATPWTVDRSALAEVAWTAESAAGRPHPVGQLRPNAFGLHDTAGNVWEWTADAWAKERPGGFDVLVADGAQRVIRGGSFVSSARNARSAYRNRLDPGNRDHGLGFRLVRPPRPP